MATPEYCPICRTLPLELIKFAVKGGGPQWEYLLEPNTFAKIDVSLDERLSSQCSIWLLAKSISQRWAGEPLPAPYPENELPLPSLHYACGKDKQQVSVMTEIGTDICEIKRWRIVYRVVKLMIVARLHVPDRWRLVHPNPSSPEVVSRLKNWISVCDDNHDKCRILEIPLLPSRVIDVGDASSGSDSVKLVETAESERGVYIALSHCWGKLSTPFTTTQSNISKMKKGFSPSIAPATFQDAIQTTRNLGIHYLWIDSLCILQDDAKDWELESSRMGAVYRDSTLTLLAMDAKSDAEGFLKMRPPTNATLMLKSPAGHTANIFLRAQGPPDYWVGRSSRTRALDTRGWCLQEAYLPKRILKFLDTQMIWYCQESCFDEAEKEPQVGGPPTGNAFTLENIFRGRSEARHRSLNLTTMYQGWYRLVANYTKRSLTKVGDRFPALSGVASMIAEHDGERYCAGLWWTDIGFGLCWKKASTLEKIEEYIAPSWSWASVTGPIEFIDAHELYLTQTKILQIDQVSFHDFHSSKRGIDEYGQLDFSWISLQAPMADVDMIDTIAFNIRGSEISEVHEMDFDLDEKTKGDLKALFLMRRLDNAQETQLVHMGISKDPLGVILFGLVIRPTERFTEGKAFGLEKNLLIYERVGFFRILVSQSREKELLCELKCPLIYLI